MVARRPRIERDDIVRKHGSYQGHKIAVCAFSTRSPGTSGHSQLLLNLFEWASFGFGHF